MDLRPGEKLNSYEIIALLGEGGMGAVWKAKDTVLGRLVAIKVVKAADPLGRLMREARTAAQLNHPNIVTIHEVGEHDGRMFVVMEFIEGQPLTRRISPKGMPLREALRYVIPIASALEAAHKLGVVHRDLKPANVMITAGGTVKLLDFGLAKEIIPPAGAGSEAETQPVLARPHTEEGQIVGTIAYMSPEQAQGKPVDARSDIFSFGTLFYEMLCGRRPFDGENKLSTLAAILRQEPAPPSEITGGMIPHDTERIVLRCLRKDPERRFQTAADLRAALEDIKQESESASISRVELPHRRSPALKAAAVVAAAVVLTAVWWASRRTPLRELPSPSQVTFEGGIAVTPAISPDGKLFAFASDRAEPGNLDIWLRQMRGGSAVRLTFQPGVEFNPQFSDDSTRLYYLNGDREIFEMPALGGPARRLAPDAGPFVISSRGEIAVSRVGPGMRLGSIFILPATGGSPEPWQQGCRAASRPAWSADGSELFFFGECGKELKGGLRAPRRGGTPVLMYKPPVEPDFSSTPGWFQPDIILPGPAGIARASLNGRLAPVTSNLRDRWPAVGANGSILFSQLEDANSIWSISGNLDKPLPQQVMSAIGHFAVSHDGTTLVYGRLVSRQSGEVVVRNLRSGEERVFAAHEMLGVYYGSIWPQISPDAKQVVYRLVGGGGQGGHYLLRTDTGEVKKIATLEEFQLGSDWSPDSKTVVGECPAPGFGICELDPASGTVRKLFAHQTDQLLYPSWSWDGRWLVFGRRKPGGRAGIWTAPVSAGKLENEDRWVEISPPGTDNSRPRFSPDGRMVYYICGRSGLRQLAVQRIDARGTPEGPLLLPLRAPVEITALMGGFGPYPLISVASGSVFYSSIGFRSNLWLTHLP